MRNLNNHDKNSLYTRCLLNYDKPASPYCRNCFLKDHALILLAIKKVSDSMLNSLNVQYSYISKDNTKIVNTMYQLLFIALFCFGLNGITAQQGK